MLLRCSETLPAAPCTIHWHCSTCSSSLANFILCIGWLEVQLPRPHPLHILRRYTHRARRQNVRERTALRKVSGPRSEECARHRAGFPLVPQPPNAAPGSCTTAATVSSAMVASFAIAPSAIYPGRSHTDVTARRARGPSTGVGARRVKTVPIFARSRLQRRP